MTSHPQNRANQVEKVCLSVSHICPLLSHSTPLHTHHAVPASSLSTVPKYRGVTYKKSTSLWKAGIKVQGSKHELGYYDTQEAAGRAYDMAYICAKGLKPKYLNFPSTDYSPHLDGLATLTVEDLSKQLRTTAAQRDQKTSKYQGIRWVRGRKGKWEASIKVASRQMYLGLYDTEQQAARAYDQAVMVRWSRGVGPSMAPSTATFPDLNFPPEEYEALLSIPEGSGSAGEGGGGRRGEEGGGGVGQRDGREEEDQEEEEEEGDDDAPSSTGPMKMLGKRYIEAVLHACRNYKCTTTTLMSALDVSGIDGTVAVAAVGGATAVGAMTTATTTTAAAVSESTLLECSPIAGGDNVAVATANTGVITSKATSPGTVHTTPKLTAAAQAAVASIMMPPPPPRIIKATQQ